MNFMAKFFQGRRERRERCWRAGEAGKHWAEGSPAERTRQQKLRRTLLARILDARKTESARERERWAK
jgi:hypothetical protein